MTLVYNAARDEMFALFEAAWNAGTSALAGYVPEIRWQGKEKGQVPSSNKYWCRVSAQSVYETQATLSTCVEEVGKKRYESSGLIFVQLFAPKSEKNAYDVGQRLAVVARDAFRGKSTANGIWFRNVRILTLDAEELSYRFNIVAEYEFDEIG